MSCSCCQVGSSWVWAGAEWGCRPTWMQHVMQKTKSQLQNTEEEWSLKPFCNWLFVFCIAFCAHVERQPEAGNGSVFLSFYSVQRHLSFFTVASEMTLYERQGQKYIYVPVSRLNCALRPCWLVGLNLISQWDSSSN